MPTDRQELAMSHPLIEVTDAGPIQDLRRIEKSGNLLIVSIVAVDN